MCFRMDRLLICLHVLAQYLPQHHLSTPTTETSVHYPREITISSKHRSLNENIPLDVVGCIKYTYDTYRDFLKLQINNLIKFNNNRL